MYCIHDDADDDDEGGTPLGSAVNENSVLLAKDVVIL